VNRDSIFETLLEEGTSLYQKRKFRGARKKFSQATLRQPKDTKARFWLGACHYHLGNITEARKQLEKVLSESKPPLPERPAAVYEFLARCFISADTKRALSLCEEGIRRDANDPRIRLICGNACLRLEQPEDALRHYDKAWALEKSREGKPAFSAHPGQIPFARSAALVQLKRWKEALGAINDALERDPENALYHNRKGVILFDGLSEPEKAVEAAERAIELDPGTVGTGNDGVYYYNLSHYLDKLNRNDHALQMIDRAIAISPRREYKEYRKKLIDLAQKKTVAEPPSSPKLDFSRVGGMKALKEQVRRIVNVIHTHRDDAKRYGIVRNGILLYGPPGCGKSFFAEAVAGEFSLNFMRVELGSALTKYVGSAGENMERVFQQAREKLPCVLFLDELDTLAARRNDAGSQHEQQMVNALLQQIDIHREVPGLVLIGATNRLDEIDPAAIREGRFDYKVKIYKPDFDARREILDVLLEDRPHDNSVDTTQLAQDMEGFTAAQIRHIVDEAALAAMESEAPISDGHLREAYNRHITSKRYQGIRLTWDDLILPKATKRKLQFIEKFIENPGVARRLGVEAPRGVLFFGPPGTGKTTIARVLASETDAAFFAVNAADIFSKWLGDSEQNVKELFEKARDSVPALIFIDEVEAVLGRRSAAASGAEQARNSVINTFLAEMDGIETNGRIFVIGATNRPELLDEASLRPGRLSEAIEIGLPNTEARLALLELFTNKMNLNDKVALEELAEDSEGASGADIKGLCTVAGRNAFLRALDSGEDKPSVIPEDFRNAVNELFPEKTWTGQKRSIGFGGDSTGT
jgi:transitional endoplasmic reticulum ATPase